MRWWWILTMLAAPALADDGIDVAAQRERIARERAQVEAEYRDEATRCAGRFSVTACVDRARSQRRVAIERLDHERALLDGMERKRRAAERTQRIQDKVRAAQSRPPPVVKEVPRSAKAPRSPASGAAASTPVASEPASATAARPGAEAAYERRQREAAEHREAVERRNAARAARRTPAAPLPVPSAASH